MRLSAKAMAYLVSSVCFLLAGLAQAECSTAPPTSGRLAVDGGEVYDNETDLTWARCSVGMNWVDGKGCIGVAARGTWKAANGVPWTEGWRIPSPEELQTILSKNCDNPSIDDRLFPKTVSDWYWTNRGDGSGCWSVSFSDSHTAANLCSGRFAIRLVRNGR